MAKIVAIPQTLSSEIVLNQIIEKYRALRLAGLKQDPKAFSSKYEDEVRFPYEKWMSRVQNPKACILIALGGSVALDSEEGGLNTLLKRDWLGSVTILGPELLSFNGISEDAAWSVFQSHHDQMPRDTKEMAAVYMISGLFILPNARGVGLGQRLVEEAVKQAKDTCGDATRMLIVLGVEGGNDAARRLYERCGFRTYHEKIIPAGTAVRMILEYEKDTCCPCSFCDSGQGFHQ